MQMPTRPVGSRAIIATVPRTTSTRFIRTTTSGRPSALSASTISDVSARPAVKNASAAAAVPASSQTSPKTSVDSGRPSGIRIRPPNTAMIAIHRRERRTAARKRSGSSEIRARAGKSTYEAAAITVESGSPAIRIPYRNCPSAAVPVKRPSRNTGISWPTRMIVVATSAWRP